MPSLCAAELDAGSGASRSQGPSAFQQTFLRDFPAMEGGICRSASPIAKYRNGWSGQSKMIVRMFHAYGRSPIAFADGARGHRPRTRVAEADGHRLSWGGNHCLAWTCFIISGSMKGKTVLMNADLICWNSAAQFFARSAGSQFLSTKSLNDAGSPP